MRSSGRKGFQSDKYASVHSSTSASFNDRERFFFPVLTKD